MFGSGGQKISDTGRVEVTVGEEKKWVTPERALDISSDKAKIAEAEGKIARREKLEQTIRARLEREQRAAETEAERISAKKKGIKLIETEREREKTLGEKVRLSLFTKQAEVRLKERKEPAQAVVTEEGFIIAPPSATIYEKEIPILRERKARKEFREPVEAQIEPEPKPEGKPIILPELAKQLAQKPIQQTVSGMGEIDLSPLFTPLPVSEVRAAPKPEGFFEEGFDILQRERFKVFKERAKEDISLGTVATGVGIGLGTSLLLTAYGAKEFATSPIETTKRTITALPLAATFVTSGALTQLIKQEPGFVAGFAVGEVAQAQLGGGAVSVASSQIRRLLARISPRFKPVVTEALGVQKIKGVKIKGKKADIGLIPEGKGLKIDFDDALLKKVDIPLEQKPTLPKLTAQQRSILDVVRKQDDLLTGSLAQKTLLKKEFTRSFGDIDIAATRPGQTAKLIKQRLGDVVDIKKVKITDSPFDDFDIFRVTEKKTGKVIADVDPLQFVEEGLATKFKTTRVGGIEFVSQEARLSAKVRQLARGKGKGGKVAKDITALTGGKVRLDTPLTRGAFGFTEVEQRALIGKTGPVTTSARDLFKTFKGSDVLIGDEGLFATPFEPSTRLAQTRITRLGLEQRRATLLDILKGDVTFKRQKPQIIVFPEQKIGDIFKITPGPELEVLAAGGQIIRKRGKVGTTIIKKKVIPIFEADIGKASGELQRLTQQARAGKISTTGRRRIRNLLSKETGFDFSGVVDTKQLFGITDIATDVLVGSTKVVQPSKRLGFDIKTSPMVSNLVSQRISKAPSKTRAVKLTRGLSGALSRALTGGISPTLTSKISTRISVPPSGILSFPPSGIVSIPPSIPPSTPPIVPPITPPPEKPPPTFIPKIPEFYWHKTKKKSKYPFGQEFAFTPDFIASVRNEFAPQPRQRRFTGQERRFIPISGKFVSPLPKVNNGGIFGLIRKQLEA